MIFSIHAFLLKILISYIISLTPEIPNSYREKIAVPADKPFITLSGTHAKSTIITWNEGWNTMESPTVSVLASDFVGRHLTIQVYHYQCQTTLPQKISEKF